MSTQFTDFTLDEDVSAATSSPQEEQPPTLEYADFELDSTPQDAARFNVRDAAPLTEAISTRRLATETGMPDFLLPDDEAPLIARELQADLEGLAERAPRTSTLLQDPGTAALLQRSVPTMSTIERDQENLRVNNLSIWEQVGHVIHKGEFIRGVEAGASGVKLMASAANTARHLAMLDHSRETLTFMDQLDASDEPQKLVVKMDPTSSSSMQSFNPSQLRMYARAPAEQRAKMRAKVEKQIKERSTAFKDGLKQVRKLQDMQRFSERPRVGALSEVTSAVDFFDYVEGNIAQMAVYMTGIVVSGAASTALTGSPLPGTLGAGYVAGTGEVYSSLVEKGMESEWKTAAIAGVPYALVELLGAPARAMKDIMNPLLTTAAKKWAAESGKEFSEATTQEYLKSLSKTELRALQDELAGSVMERVVKEGIRGGLSEAFLNELPQQIIEDIAVASATGEDLIQDGTLVKWADAAAAGFFGGGPFSAAGAAFSRRRDDKAISTQRQFEDLTDELRTVHNSHMKFVEEQGTLEGWVEATRGDELFQSAPEIYADHLAKVLTEDGSEQQVWVDVKAVEEFFQQEDVPLTMDDFAAAVKEVRTQMAGAQEMGGDLVLPASKVVAFLSQQDKVEGLMNLMRLSPESATKSAYDAQVESLMGPAMTKLQADEKTLAAGEAHEKRLVENFTQVGYSKKYAKHYASAFRSFYETQAARLKGNPEALAVLEQRMEGLSARRGEDEMGRNVSELEMAALFQEERRTVAQAMPNTKVVGEDGLPLRVFHGTPENFAVFDTSGWEGGSFFSSSSEVGSAYAGDEGAVMPVYLDIQNPYETDWSDWLAGHLPERAELEAMGYDGIHIPASKLETSDPDDVGAERNSDTYIAFEPTQIKSAVGNRGTFDMNDPNILNQEYAGDIEHVAQLIREGATEAELKDWRRSFMDANEGTMSSPIAMMKGNELIAEAKALVKGRVGPSPSVREDGRVELTHWSYRDDLTTLDPAKYGTNNAGAERDRAQLPDFVPRTYYGVDVQLEGGYRPEAQNGTHVYKTSVDPDELYPLHEDPDALKREGMSTNEYEKAIKDAGYKGYWVDAPYIGRTAAVFAKLKPETTELNQSFEELPPNIAAFRAEQEARPVAYVTPEPVTNADGSFRKNPKGDITGAPEGVKTKRHVNARVKKLLAMLEHEYALMPDSAYWYEDAGVALRALVGDDPALMERMVRLLAFFSPSTQVGANTTFAVTAAYQYLDGDPIVTGRFPNVTRQRIGEILEAEDMTMELPGVSDKVLNFYRNLWDAAFLSDKYEGAATMDMWMAKLFGYKEIDKVEGGGSRGSSYKLSDSQYRFANYLNDLVTEAYSKKHDVPLKPRMIQAALWAYGRNAEKYKGTDGLPTKDDLIGFDTYFARATQHVTVEARPSESSGVLLGLKDAPVNVQEAYTQKMLNLLVNDVGGNELFTRLGVPLSQADDSAGSFEGVVSPNRIMGMVTRTDKGTYDTTKADLAALSLAYIYSQDAVPWMQFDPKATAKSGAVVRPTIRFKSPPSRATMEGFNQALSEAGLGAEFTKVGNDLLIFYFGDMKPKQLVDALKAVADDYDGPGADQLDSITTGAKVSGKLIDVNDDLDASWENEADAVEKLESAISERGRPDLLPWLRDRRAAVQKLNADIERASADGTIRIEPDEPGRIEGTQFTEPGLVNEYDQSQDYSPVESLPGFHSRLTRVMAERLPKKPQTPQKMLAQVRNVTGARNRTFKQEELAWVGLEPWLENLEQERVTRDEVLQFIQDSQAQFEVVENSNAIDEDAFADFVTQIMEDEYDIAAIYELLPSDIEQLELEHGGIDPEHFVVWETAGDRIHSSDVFTTRENAIADLYEELTYSDNLRDVFEERTRNTQYDSVVLGGAHAGDNYREVLLKLRGNKYKHPHWGYSLGVMLHLRMDDRVSSDGNKLLFVNELQSDMHQQARKAREQEVERVLNKLVEKRLQEDPALDTAAADELQDAYARMGSSPPAIEMEAILLTETADRLRVELRKEAEKQVPADFGYAEDASEKLQEVLTARTRVLGLRDGILEEARSLDESPEADVRRRELTEQLSDLAAEEKTLMMEQRRLERTQGGVPDAPFKNTNSWALLGMKRALQDAVLNGYDELAWTTGDQQVDMESLTEQRHIDGMRGFYDKLLPSIMNSYLKQWKVKVGESTIMAPDMQSLEPDVLVPTKVHSIRITDEMRESVRAGQELFQDPQQGGRRGSIQFSGDESVINLFAAHNESTMLHEAGHFFLETQKVIAESGSAPSTWMADWNATKEWLGAEDGNITREQHELYARTFEQYLRTGNAPSTRLRRHFQAFKRWLISIYRDAKQLNAPIDKTISDLMDRMLATDEELEEIQTRPVFAEDENFLQFLTAAERNSYLLRLKRQSESARETLLAKAMKEAERTTKQWWKDAREKALSEVDVDIAQRPVYQAIHFMRTGQLLGRNVPEGVELERIQINRPLAIEMFGEDVVKALPTGVTTKTGGAHPEFLADQFGFSSASEFILALRDAKDIKVLRQEEADALMVKRHGDMLNDGTIEQRALEAMEGQDRTEVLLYEAQVLARKSNKPSAVREDIQARAQAILADTTIGDILKNLQGYYRAEVKAAAQAGRHLAKKNYELAGQAKQQQLLNHMLYREALQQRDFFKKRLRQFKKLEKPQTRGKVKIDDDYHKKIQQLLVEYNFGSELTSQSVEKLTREALLDWVAKKETNDFAVLHVPEKLLRATKQNWRELTLDEFMSLSDMVENLETQGRMQRSVLIDGKVLDLGEAAEELADSVRNTIEEKEWEPQPRDKLPDLKNKVGNYFFGLMRARTLIRKLDGWKDDGIAHRYLLRAIDRAESDRQHRMKLTARAIEDLFKKHYGKSLRSLTELKRKTHIPELNKSLDREGLIAIALNMGNEDSANKLVGGYAKRGWTHDKVRAAIANHLTDADLAFVNDVWKSVDSFWPEIEALEKRTVGVAPAKVPASPFTLVRDDGTEIEMAGGYYPLKFDELQSDDVPDPASMAMSEIMKTGRFASAQTQKGHTAARVEHQGKPVRLDLGVLFSHVNQVVTDLTMREAIENSYRLLKHAKVRETVTDHAGLNHYQQLKLWLEDTAVDVVSTGGTMTKALDGLRAGVSIAVMGFKFTTVAVQLTGYTHSLVELGPRWAMEGVKDLMGGGNPAQLQRNLQMIMEKSHIMFDRSTTFHRDVNDAMRVMQRKGVIRGNIAKAGFWPIVKMQMVVDSATWLGAYKKGLKTYEGQEFQDAKAVEFADATVLKTQGSGLMKDLSAYERGTTDNTTRLTSTIRLFTVFQSYFITKYNLALERTAMKNLKDPMQVGQLAYEYAAMFWLEALLGEMILNKMPEFGDDEEEENFAWWSTKLALNNVTAMFPLLREISGAAQGFGGAPPGLRGLESVGSMVGQAGGAVQDWMEDDEINGYALAKSVISSVGIIAKVPVEWLNQILRGVKQEEEKGNTSWWDYVRYNKKEQ